MAEYLEQLATDTFTGTGFGTTWSVVNKPVKYYAVQAVGTGAAATSWTVILEGSLDNVSFTEITTHINTSTPDGQIKWPDGIARPALHFRTRVTALVLGSATNIKTYVYAVE